jgi:hypothetical protein
MSDTQKLIADECDQIKAMLIDKNRKYGDSAVNPVRIFSKADPTEQFNVRMDDKLSRIKSAQADDLEDAEFDLLGYLILKRVAKRAKAVSNTAAPDYIGQLREMARDRPPLFKGSIPGNFPESKGL